MLRELVEKHTIAPHWSAQLKRMTQERVDWKAIGQALGRVPKDCGNKHRSTKDRVILLTGAGSAGCGVDGGMGGGSVGGKSVVDDTQSMESEERVGAEKTLTSAAVMREVAAGRASGSSGTSGTSPARAPAPQASSSSNSRFTALLHSSSTSNARSSASSKAPLSKNEAGADSDSFCSPSPSDDEEDGSEGEDGEEQDKVEGQPRPQQADSGGEEDGEGEGEEEKEEGAQLSRVTGVIFRQRMRWTPELVSFLISPIACVFNLMLINSVGQSAGRQTEGCRGGARHN